MNNVFDICIWLIAFQFPLLFIEFVLCLLSIGMVALVGQVSQEVKKVFLTDFLSFRKRIIGSIVDGFR